MGYVLIVAVITIWVGLCIYAVWQQERLDKWQGPSEREMERLLKEQLPPMRGMRVNEKGDLERY